MGFWLVDNFCSGETVAWYGIGFEKHCLREGWQRKSFLTAQRSGAVKRLQRTARRRNECHFKKGFCQRRYAKNIKTRPHLSTSLYLCHMRKIKLIWDFRGPAAAKTAEHHEKHLKEFIAIERLPLDITGFDIINEMHATAFMVVEEPQMITVRDALKPHRGEVYEG